MSVRDLQSQTNRFATTLGFSKLVVDGKLGPKTTAAVQKVAKYLVSGGHSESMVVASVAQGAGASYILTTANLLTDSFKEAANGLGIAGTKVWRAPAPTTTTPPGVKQAGFPFLPVLAGLLGLWVLTSFFSRRR